ncbi:uncharacterized protein M421DRAFT_10442 [Didymella exigua CBS 183.55]|uniref:Uncharacterized protein n=1 Tax=Didymella exigua CBS 183.55 TaxID=1150837 RepID=A0A6A5R5W1_9PLEO|nr:uncharacterized protein M421DRAFT_10442 [Didymella exigua CBS 183.55]KAF1922580.1 hypothetical protein M421DRAFT_10442 [Didymella exigua CBS 183.55]
MAAKSDPAVTRVTVILNTPDDWFTWLFIRQDVANRYSLWQYINPDTTESLTDGNVINGSAAALNISKTIAVRHIHLIKDHETPYNQLVALKKFLCPTDATRRCELADKYNTLKTAPRAAKKVEQWLTDWVYITAQGKSITLPETDGN